MLEEKLRAYINELEKNSHFAKYDIYKKYIASLSVLGNRIHEYTKITENGYPVLDQDALDRLKQGYSIAIEDASQFLAIFNKRKSNDALGYSLELIEGFNDLLIKDLSAIENAHSKAQKTYPEIISASRGIDITVKGNKLSKVGENSSERIPVTYTDDKGETVKGFFTEDVRVDYAKERDKIFDEIIAESPKHAKMFKLLKDVDFGSHPMVGKRYDGRVKDWLPYLSVNALGPDVTRKDEYKFVETRMELYKDYEYLFYFYKLYKLLHPLYVKENLEVNALKIKQNSNYVDRNVAMSEIAKILGVPNLIANSQKMTLSFGKEKKEGVFTSFAEGLDLNDAKVLEKLGKLDENAYNNPSAFKSIADLQVLDYICGNVDRHARNMFYKFDKNNKLIGVVGIDNDCSMGTFIDKKHNISCMTIPENMKVISEECAAKISEISPDMLSVCFDHLNLSEEEIKAAQERLEILKQNITASREYFKEHPDEKLKEGCIKIVKSADWNKYSIDELSNTAKKQIPFGYKTAEVADTSKDNYFNTIKDTPENVKYISEQKSYRDAFENYVKLEFEDKTKDNTKDNIKDKTYEVNGVKYDFFKNPITPVSAAKAVQDDVTTEVGIKNTRQRLTEFKNRLKGHGKFACEDSQEYRNLVDTFKKLKSMTDDITPQTGSNVLKKISKEYRNLQNATQEYIEKVESDHLDNEPLDNISKRSLTFARELKAVSAKKIVDIDHHIEDEAYKLAKLLKAKEKKWDNDVLGKLYDGTDAMKEKIARAVLKTAFIDHPEAMQHMSINDFKVGLTALMKRPEFKNNLVKGQPVDMKKLLAANFTHAYKPEPQAAPNNTVKQL